jgi:hypothetical protein
MKFSFNNFGFVLLVAAVLFVTSAADQPVDLGDACDFAVLAKTGITTVPASVITGNIGVAPITSTAMTGFSLTADASTVFSTSGQVNGQCLASNYGVPTPANMVSAIAAMEAAYTAGNNRVATYATNPGDGAGGIGGATFFPGVYKFAGVTINIATNITLDAQDDPNAVFIITTTNQLVLAAGKSVVLANGARADNIFWHVAGYVTIGTTAHMEGNILSYTSILLSTGSFLNGRALAQTAVTLQQATVTKPNDCGDVKDDPALLICD